MCISCEHSHVILCGCYRVGGDHLSVFVGLSVIVCVQVLLKLMMIKTPITEADSIRALACKVPPSRRDNIAQLFLQFRLYFGHNLCLCLLT